jgi:tRNA A37 threonylcarbamoyladenosine dehydratase
MDINPALKHTGRGISISRACLQIVSEEFDYVLDCIDSITPKLDCSAKEKSEDHKQYGMKVERWKLQK